jgi:hypothetical protein
MNELSMLNSMISRLANALDWLGIVYVSFMFIVVIWKPNRIFSVGTYRLSVLLFALSVLSPAVVNFGWNFYKANQGSAASQSGYSPARDATRETESRIFLLSQCAQEASRIMLGVAIALGILSLLESPHARHRPTATDKKIEPPPGIDDGSRGAS